MWLIYCLAWLDCIFEALKISLLFHHPPSFNSNPRILKRHHLNSVWLLSFYERLYILTLKLFHPPATTIKHIRLNNKNNKICHKTSNKSLASNKRQQSYQFSNTSFNPRTNPLNTYLTQHLSTKPLCTTAYFAICFVIKDDNTIKSIMLSQ